MPRVRYPITDFSRGELSPTIEGRIDLDQYKRGARRMLNATVLEEGGATRRPGMRYVAPAKNPTTRCHLETFQTSDGAYFTLEFGEGSIRFYKGSSRVEVAGVPVEVATPYLAADLLRLKCVPIRDVLFIFCQFYQTRRLEHYSDTVWKLRTVPSLLAFIPRVTPGYEYGERPVTTVAAGATTGAGVTFTAGAAQFLASDVGREIVVFAGANIGARAYITAYTDTSHVVATIVEPFATTGAIAATDWKLTGSPLTKCTPSAAGPVNASITLALTADGFRATDAGKQCHINGGLALVTGAISTVLADAIVLVAMSGSTAAEAGAWSLEEPAWSSYNGFPGAGADWQGRLWTGGTLAQPWQLWATPSGDYDTWPEGVNADDGLSFGLTTSQIRWLLASDSLLVGGSEEESVVDGGGTGGDSVVTPTTVRERPQTAFGSTDEVTPKRAGAVSLFASRSGRRLREYVYDYTAGPNGAYLAPDLLLLSKHLTRDAVLLQVAHQREPLSTIWAPRDDGVLLGATYLRDQNVVAWHRHVTPGLVESVAVSRHPDGTKDRVWLAVVRTINGAATRTIEYFDDDGHAYRQLHVDSAITYDHTVTGATVSPAASTGIGVAFAGSGAPFVPGDVGSEIRRIPMPGRALITGFTNADLVTADIISDFAPGVIPSGSWAICPYTYTIPHLAGQTVEATVDGAVVPETTANASGNLTLADTGVLVEIGLGYDTEVETMPAEVLSLGTTAPLPKRNPEFFIKFFETLGAEVQGEQVTFRRTSHALGVVPEPATEAHMVRMRGYDMDATVVIAQRQPLPMTVLFVALLPNVGA